MRQSSSQTIFFTVLLFLPLRTEVCSALNTGLVQHWDLVPFMFSMSTDCEVFPKAELQYRINQFPQSSLKLTQAAQSNFPVLENYAAALEIFELAWPACLHSLAGSPLPACRFEAKCLAHLAGPVSLRPIAFTWWKAPATYSLGNCPYHTNMCSSLRIMAVP